MTQETFQWTKHREGKCRQVARCIWSPEVSASIEDELQKLHHHHGRLYLDDGTAFSATKQRIERKLHQQDAVERSLRAHPVVRDLLDYMNGLPPNLFTKQLRNHERAVALANEISNPEVRQTQLRILAAIRDQPQPFYAPSRAGRTVRIFAASEGLTSLCSNIRKAMCIGWSEADLTNSQLSILATLWHINELDAFLRSNKSIWDHLIEILENPPLARAVLKNALKEPVYALAYGMRASKVQEEFTKNLKKLGIKGGGAKIFQSQLIRALLDARKRAAAQVRADRGGATCFGDFLPLGDLKEYQILSLQAQAIEMSLLLPVVELAKETDDFAVTLWQHDGFAVNFTRRREQTIARINRLVKEKAESFDIHTNMEWNHDYIQTDAPTPLGQGGTPPRGLPPYSITEASFYSGGGRKMFSEKLPLAYAA